MLIKKTSVFHFDALNILQDSLFILTFNKLTREVQPYTQRGTYNHYTYTTAGE